MSVLTCIYLWLPADIYIAVLLHEPTKRIVPGPPVMPTCSELQSTSQRNLGIEIIFFLFCNNCVSRILNGTRHQEAYNDRVFDFTINKYSTILIICECSIWIWQQYTWLKKYPHLFNNPSAWYMCNKDRLLGRLCNGWLYRDKGVGLVPCNGILRPCLIPGVRR